MTSLINKVKLINSEGIDSEMSLLIIILKEEEQWQNR